MNSAVPFAAALVLTVSLRLSNVVAGATEMATTVTITVEDTIAAVKRGAIATRFGKTNGKFNPGAKQEIIRMLHDGGQKNYWLNTLSALGGMATAEDIGSILLVLKQLHGVLPPGLQQVPTYAMDVLSNMSKRGVSEARLELRSMINPEYWLVYDFSVYETLPKMYVNNHTYWAHLALSLYSSSGDPEFPQQAPAIIARVKDEPSRKYLMSLMPGYLKNHQEMTDALASGDPQRYFTDLLKSASPKRTDASRQETIKPERLSKAGYGKVLEAKNARTDFTTATGNKEIQSEAIVAFHLIADALRNGNMEYVVQHVADDGRPVLLADEVTSESVKSYLDRADLIKALSDEKELLSHSAFTAPDPLLRAIYAYRFDNATSRTLTIQPGQDPKQVFDLIVVHLAVPRLAFLKEKAPRFFRPHPSPFEDTQADPYPVITMIWQAGRWYWNPFGW